MTRGKRIAVELLGPPAFGAGLMAIWTVPAMLMETTKPQPWLESFQQGAAVFAVLLLFAYVFAGAQSVAYTVVMEWRFRRGLDPRGWRAVGWSAILGFFSGSAIAVVMGGSSFAEAWPALGFWSGFGAVVGFLNGTLIRSLARRTKQEASPATPSSGTET